MTNDVCRHIFRWKSSFEIPEPGEANLREKVKGYGRTLKLEEK